MNNPSTREEKSEALEDAIKTVNSIFFDPYPMKTRSDQDRNKKIQVFAIF